MQKYGGWHQFSSRREGPVLCEARGTGTVRADRGASAGAGAGKDWQTRQAPVVPGPSGAGRFVEASFQSADSALTGDSADGGVTGETGLCADCGLAGLCGDTALGADTGLCADCGVIGLGADSGVTGLGEETGVPGDGAESDVSADAGEGGVCAVTAEGAVWTSASARTIFEGETTRCASDVLRWSAVSAVILLSGLWTAKALSAVAVPIPSAIAPREPVAIQIFRLFIELKPFNRGPYNQR